MFNKKYFMVLALIFTSANCDWFKDTYEKAKKIGEDTAETMEKKGKDVAEVVKEANKTKYVTFTIKNKDNKKYMVGFKDHKTGKVWNDFEIQAAEIDMGIKYPHNQNINLEYSLKDVTDWRYCSLSTADSKPFNKWEKMKKGLFSSRVFIIPKK